MQLTHAAGGRDSPAHDPSMGAATKRPCSPCRNRAAVDGHAADEMLPILRTVHACVSHVYRSSTVHACRVREGDVAGCRTRLAVAITLM